MFITGHEFYGGATVMRLADANGVPFMSCCTTRQSDKLFAFRIFKGPNLEEVPLNPVCTGRGSMNVGGWWVAALGKEFFTGPIPGFAPHPNAANFRDARVDALISQIGNLGQRIVEIERALGNISQEPGALDPVDRVALDRLRAFLGIA